MRTKVVLSIAVIVLAATASHFYDKSESYKDKYNQADKALATASETINRLNIESKRINKLNDANSRKIQTLINQSTVTQKQMLDEIKNIVVNNQSCANGNNIKIENTTE